MDICLGIPCKICDICFFSLENIKYRLVGTNIKTKKKKSSLILKEFSLKCNEIGLGYVKIKLR